MILELHLPPGSSVSEVKLSKELGISRTPVREALSRLVIEGLVISEGSRKRVYVLTREEMREIFDLKLAIEPYMAKLAAERLDEKHAAEFRKLTDRMTLLPAADQAEVSHDHSLIADWLTLDKEFHSTLFSAAQNRRAHHIVTSMNAQWHRLATGLLAMEGRVGQNIREHLAMAEAILDRRADESEKLMCEHLTTLRNTILTLMKAFHYTTM